MPDSRSGTRGVDNSFAQLIKDAQARCQQELQAIRDCQDEQSRAYLSAMGEADWHVEQHLIEQEAGRGAPRGKSLASGLCAPGPLSGPLSH